jgi:hypothetical protein
MSDYLRITWARFHLDIARHSQAMIKFINSPAPRPGDVLRVPVGTGDVETNFVLRFPGMMNLESEGYVGVDYAMYVSGLRENDLAPSVVETNRMQVAGLQVPLRRVDLNDLRGTCFILTIGSDNIHRFVRPPGRSVTARTRGFLLSLPRHAQYCRGDLSISARIAWLARSSAWVGRCSRREDLP